MKANIERYCAIISERGDYFEVEFPDLEGASTFGDTFEDAINMATEFLELYLYDLKMDGIKLPSPKNYTEKLSQNQALVLVSANLTLMEKKFEAKLVKKTLSISAAANELGKENNINFSKLLEETIFDVCGYNTNKVSN